MTISPQPRDLTASLYRFTTLGLGYDKVNVDEHAHLLNLLTKVYEEWKSNRARGTRRQTIALILLPRGTYKTTVASVAFPMWVAEQNPDVGMLIDSETYKLSKSIVSEIKQQYEGGPYTQYFDPVTEKNAIRWAEDSIILPSRKTFQLYGSPRKEGTFDAAGIDGVRAGMHYDFIIADDLHSQHNTKTRPQIDQVIEHYQLLGPILNPDGVMVVIGTKWSTDDAYVAIKKDINPKNYLFIPATSTLPMNVGSKVREMPFDRLPLATPAASAPASAPDPITGKVMERVDNLLGENPLTAFEEVQQTRLTFDNDASDCLQRGRFYENFPKILSQEYLDKAESRGVYVYSAQYLLWPVVAREKRFREEWIKFYVEDPAAIPHDYPVSRPPLLSHKIFRRIGIVDPAFTTQEYSDPSGIIILATSHKRDIYVKYAEEHLLEPYQLVDLIFQLHDEHNVEQWYIEEVAAQRVLRFYMEYVARHTNRRITLNPVKSGGKRKDIRIMSLQPFFQNQRIWLREDQETLLNQIRRFPILKNDDVLDALAYGPQVVYDGVQARELITRPEGTMMQDLIDELSHNGEQTGIRPMNWRK